MSSLTTNTFSGGVRYQDEIKRTGAPERFMYDVGFTKTASCATSRACIALSRRFHESTP